MPTQYPIQAPPPSLGYTFYQEGHGLILKQMLMIVEQVALGTSSVEEGLKIILSKLQCMFENCRLINHPVI